MYTGATTIIIVLKLLLYYYLVLIIISRIIIYSNGILFLPDINVCSFYFYIGIILIYVYNIHCIL